MRHWIITKQGYMFLTMRRHWLQRETWILSQSLSHWQLIKDTRCIPWSRNDFLNWTSRGRSLQEISPSFGSIEEITCGWQRSPIWNELLSHDCFVRITLAMVSLGNCQSQDDHDHTLFIEHTLEEKLTLLLVYVDERLFHTMTNYGWKLS